MFRTDTFAKPSVASITSSIGGTPMIRIRHLVSHLPDVQILVKAEWLNPGGSVKDRAALSMIEAGLKSEQLREGKTILEATSGNTGIALSMIGASLGYPVTICLPENASVERKRLLEAYGATIVATSRLEGTDGAIRKARSLFGQASDRYFYPDQYNNENNWLAHYRTTAVEIWEQCGHTIDHFVCGLGTSGTFTGVTRRLKELATEVNCVAVEPAEPMHGIEGWKHMATSLKPGIYDSTLADDRLEVSTEDATTMVRRLAREEGLLVGISSGAAMVAALRLAGRARNGVIVTVFPDGGNRYLAEGPFTA